MSSTKNSTPRMYVTYLLNAEFKKTNDRDKALEIIPGTASPIKNQWVAAKPIKFDSKGNRVVSKTGKWKHQVLWYSDGTGLLRTLRKQVDTRVVRVKPDVHDICFVPKEICKRSVIAKGVDGWAEHILEFLKENPFKEQLIKETIILKKHLRKPTPDEKTPDPQPDEKTSNPQPKGESYGNWYEKLANDRAIKAIVIAKIRAIVFLFSSPDYGNHDKLRIEIIDPKGKPISSSPMQVQLDQNETFSYCVASTSDPAITSDLPNGLYTIKVILNGLEKSGLWSEQVVQDKSYTLQEMVRYSIKNPAGEFEVIHCDPISLEEAVILQHATRYSHLLSINTQQSELYKQEAQLSREERTKNAITKQFAKSESSN